MYPLHCTCSLIYLRLTFFCLRETMLCNVNLGFEVSTDCLRWLGR
jgi:hypothetical protein